MANNKHGHARGQGTPTYKSWCMMLTRVRGTGNERQRRRYQGLELEPGWENFTTFLADIGERPEGYTLDRRDNEAGYTKANCRWATPTTQARNTRRRKDNVTGVRGVHYDRIRSKWMAYITACGRQITLGRYTDLDDAIATRKAGEEKYWK